MSRPRYLFTIGRHHLPAHYGSLADRRDALTAGQALGRILPGDVGKRVYDNGGVIQVENDEQRAARLAKQGDPKP